MGTAAISIAQLHLPGWTETTSSLLTSVPLPPLLLLAEWKKKTTTPQPQYLSGISLEPCGAVVTLLIKKKKKRTNVYFNFLFVKIQITQILNFRSFMTDTTVASIYQASNLQLGLDSIYCCITSVGNTENNSRRLPTYKNVSVDTLLKSVTQSVSGGAR